MNATVLVSLRDFCQDSPNSLNDFIPASLIAFCQFSPNAFWYPLLARFTRKGKVASEDIPVQGAEILNLRSKKTVITDLNGDFSIMAKVKDTLMLIAKNYQYKKLILEKEHNEENKLLILLVRKPEELEEVVVISKIAFPKIKLDKKNAYLL